MTFYINLRQSKSFGAQKNIHLKVLYSGYLSSITLAYWLIKRQIEINLSMALRNNWTDLKNKKLTTGVKQSHAQEIPSSNYTEYATLVPISLTILYKIT